MNSKDKRIFHLSEYNLDGVILTPKVPSNFLTKNGYEDNITPRVCFSTSIQGSLVGISNNLQGKEFYIHIPDKYVDFYVPTKEEVPDVKCSHEVWVQKPIKLKVYKKIKVTSAQDTPLHYRYGDNMADAYKYNYDYIPLSENSWLLVASNKLV